MHVKRILVMVIVLVLAVMGCGEDKRSTEQKEADETASRIASKAMTIASGKEVNVEVNGETVQFKDADGNVTVHAGKGAKLLDEFPSDLHVYPEGEIIHTTSMGENEFSVTMQTKDDLNKVVDFHKKKMTEEGWQSETSMDMPNRAMLSYMKGDRVANLMIVQDKDGGTVISITTAVAK